MSKDDGGDGDSLANANSTTGTRASTPAVIPMQTIAELLKSPLETPPPTLLEPTAAAAAAVAAAAEMNDASQQQKQRLDAFVARQHSLRLSASNVAAMAGFHPWKNLPRLFLLDLVYQGTVGKELLQRDAGLLGLSLSSSSNEHQQQIMLDLAAKTACVATHQAVQEAIRVHQGQRVLPTVEAATAFQQKAAAAVRLAQEKSDTNKSALLTRQEWHSLTEGIRHSVNTGYGMAHEDAALDMYEKHTGWPVLERNAQVRIWQFAKVDNDSYDEPDDNDDPLQKQQPTVVPLKPAFPLDRRNSNNGSHELAPRGDCCQEKEDKTNGNGSEMDAVRDYPYFSILGSVDGIREELAPNCTTKNIIPGQCPVLEEDNDDDDDSWVIHKVIVECKHRMHKMHNTPPIYEQIQAVIYCLMYNVENADLVQVLRTSKKRHETERTPGGQKRSKTMQDYFPVPITSVENSNNTSFSSETVDDDTVARDESIHASSTPGSPILSSHPAIQSHKPCCDTTTTCNVTTIQTEAQQPRVIIAVNRISVNDPIVQHGIHWNHCILPRLRSFCDAVYRVRGCDDTRYRMLWAVAHAESMGLEHQDSEVVAEDAHDTTNQLLPWHILLGECPWLKDCDTAFHNDRFK